MSKERVNGIDKVGGEVSLWDGQLVLSPERLRQLSLRLEGLRGGTLGQPVLLIDKLMGERRGAILNTDPWQFVRYVEGDGRLDLGGEKVGVVVMVTGGLNQQMAGSMVENLAGLVPHLKKQGAVFVWEERREGGRERGEVGWREEVIQAAGLVRGRVLQRVAGGRRWWEARLPKKRKARRADFLNGGPSWRKQWIRGLMAKVVGEYASMGYKVEDMTAIRRRLKDCRFPPGDLLALRCGFGVVATLNCDCGRCTLVVDLEGNERVERSSDCDGVPQRVPTKEELLRVFGGLKLDPLQVSAYPGPQESGVNWVNLGMMARMGCEHVEEKGGR